MLKGKPLINKKKNKRGKSMKKRMMKILATTLALTSIITPLNVAAADFKVGNAGNRCTDLDSSKFEYVSNSRKSKGRRHSGSML